MKKKGERYTVAVDFDGVLHSYTSPWMNARTIPDPPVPGAIEWLAVMLGKFDVAITSTRNTQWLGKYAMRAWLRRHLYDYYWQIANASGRSWTHADVDDEAWIAARDAVWQLKFPKHKPPALIYLDDRAWRFRGPGTWPTAQEIHQARPWNK